MQQTDNPLQRLKAADKETIVSWLESAVSSLIQKKDIIMKSFKVCGITCKTDGSEDALICSETMLEDVGINADSDSETEEVFEGFAPEDRRFRKNSCSKIFHGKHKNRIRVRRCQQTSKFCW